MSSHATERISLIRTVKAFADEKDSIDVMEGHLDKILEKGKKKAYAFAILMICFQVTMSLSFVGVMYLASIWYAEDNMSIGQVMSYLLYLRQFNFAFMEVSGHIQTVAKVAGASKKIAELIIQEPSVVIKDES